MLGGEHEHPGAGVPYTGEGGGWYSGMGFLWNMWWLLWQGKQMATDEHSGEDDVDDGRCVLPATATKVPVSPSDDSGSILDGSWPGHGASVAALCSCATQSAPRRSAATGTSNAPAPSSSPTALLSYSSLLPFLHLIATLSPLKAVSASMFFLPQPAHLAAPTTTDAVAVVSPAAAAVVAATTAISIISAAPWRSTQLAPMAKLQFVWLSQ